ncbi:hypothetical protein POUND7_007280 [Theobroma cacao]
MAWTCGTLVDLDLSGNNLSGGFPKTFKSCDSLQSLNLRSLDASDEHTLPMQKQNQSNEVMALFVFKQKSVDADHKGFLDNWSAASSSPCSWQGVSCSPRGQVRALNLTQAGVISNLHIDDPLVLGNLKHLHLSGNSFSGNLFHNKTSYPCIIQTLDLSFKNLSEPISNTFFHSSDHFTSLNLSHSSIPGGGFNFGTSLLELDLSSNLISNSLILDYSFSNCQNMKLLNLPHNKLSGKLVILFMATGIPQSLTNSQLLESLDLSHNKLQDKIPAALGKLGNLKCLNLGYNDFSGNIPPELGWICGTLIELDLSGNELSGGFPKSFKLCNSLQSLNLGNNQLSGNFLTSVISTLPSLQILQIPFNNISVPIPLSLRNCTQLQVLDLSSNAFSGEILSGLCFSSPISTSLTKLLLASNFLSGTKPSDLGNCQNLRTINLAHNHLSGCIPSEVWKLPHLSDMIMWGNNFSGEIPKDICFGTSNLEKLSLAHNLFSGNIPTSVTNCKNLVWLSLSSNQLSGKIPAGIGNLQKLSVLQLSSNNLSGNIPTELGGCQSLIWLGLRSNYFTGSIPSDLANQTGLVPKFTHEAEYAFLRNISRSDCRTTSRLIYYDGIRRERLEDALDLKSCPTVRLYSGFPVHRSLGSLSFLADCHVSDNNLTGTIPSAGQLTTFPASSYENNPGLCGIPLPPCESLPETDLRSSEQHEKKNNSVLNKLDSIWFIASDGTLLV